MFLPSIFENIDVSTFEDRCGDFRRSMYRPSKIDDRCHGVSSRTAHARGNASTQRFNFLINIFIKWRSGNEAMTSLQLSFYSSRLHNAMLLNLAENE